MMFEMGSIVMFYFGVIILVLTKYFSIYHGPFLAIFDEGKLLKKVKIFFIIVPIILVAIQNTFGTDVENLSRFQDKFYGHYKTNIKVEVVTEICKYGAVLSVTTLYLYIEYTNGLLEKLKSFLRNPFCFKKNNDSNNVYEIFGYNGRVIQVVIVICTTTLIPTIISIPQMWRRLYLVTVISVVVPLLIIFKHEGMTKTALKLLKSLMLK